MIDVSEVFSYNPDNGEIRWAISPYKSARKKGDLAGCLDSNGYRKIQHKGTQYYGHRIAVYLMTGKWPSVELEVDHIDRNPSNNCWDNIRIVTVSQNQHNRGAPVNSTTGHKGVRFKLGKYEVNIIKDGISMYLGRYSKLEDAVQVRKYAEASKGVHGAF